VLVVVFVKTDVVSVVKVVDVDVVNDKVVGQSQSRLGLILGSRVDVVRSGSSVDVVRSVGHVGPEVTGHEVTEHGGHEVAGFVGQEASHGHQGIQTSL